MRTSLRVHPQETAPLLQRRGGGLSNSYSNSPYKKPRWYKRPKFYINILRRGLAEFLGTALFVFIAVSSASSVNIDSDCGRSVSSSSATVVALATGFAYAALMAANGHVSGGHMNPAVTVGVFIAGGINVVAAAVYILVQLIGGIVGAACVLAYDNDDYYPNGTDPNSTEPESVVDYGLTNLQGVTPLQGIAVETVLTLMVVMVYTHTTMEGDNKGEHSHRNFAAPLATGFAMAAGIMSSYFITGGSFNPARSLGPAVVGSSPSRWDYHYVYWIGPTLGAMLAGVFYRLVLSSNPLIPLTDTDSKTRGSINTHSQ
uniref:Aquaporin n=1 Tax=Suberites domuncula TaxID=55567 RepID=F8K9X4_SUBDO|nr:aquaporin [Suberites domuncula]